ncbi:MAG: DoxX family protein [Pirellulales bacterium]|nr:DoxX family protein [Pirellulales bacterium]
MNANASNPSVSKARCCAWSAAAALLLLRLCLGWHFFSEGTKKLSYDQARDKWSIDFSAEGFLRAATGPFAPLFKSQLPGFHDWENLLSVPNQSTPPSSHDLKKRQKWLSDYAARQRQTEKENSPPLIEFPEFAPYSAWARQIASDWRGQLKQFTDLAEISEEQAVRAAARFDARHEQLADILAAEVGTIEDYQHELWRLKQLQRLGGASEVPFRRDRVAGKRTETAGLVNPLVKTIRGLEGRFHNDLRSVLTAEQSDDWALIDRVESVLAPPKQRRLAWLNICVTGLILAVGSGLLLGLFTRLAALGGIVFLLSVMASQLPWLPGADGRFFYYQLVECAGLLALLACSPWRLPGLDYLLDHLWCCLGGAKKRTVL